MGPVAEASFLDHTFLSDRVTPLRNHLVNHPNIMEEHPPASLAERYKPRPQT